MLTTTKVNYSTGLSIPSSTLGSTTAFDINTDTSADFGPMMTLPTPSPSMDTFDR